MSNRLGEAISPYLRSHADNPVDWYPWSEEAFAAARERDVPVLVSIGYSTCHWCHVMARESFSDPALAERLNAGFVAIKVDREEHPEVDAVYLAAAGAFTKNLGWPLNVFTTPAGQAFFAGTYSPPVAVDGHPSFGQLLDAVSEAWTIRRAEVESIARELAAAIADAATAAEAPRVDRDAVEGVVTPETGDIRASGLSDEALATVVAELEEYEDRQFGGFGGAPKFPVAPVLRFLIEAGTRNAAAGALAERTLQAMAESTLRDPVEGGFFRYATRRDWSDPHYERMLYDNALLLDAYVRASTTSDGPWARETAEGIAEFLIGVMQLPSGAFASAQDSESTVDGERVEGGYYLLDAAERARQSPPALDEKVLTGWNGLAIGALARASLILDRPEWAIAAQHAADYLLAAHVDGDVLVRASVGERRSSAPATLEDYGMFAEGLLRLAAATGSARYAVAGRMLVDAVVSVDPVVAESPPGTDPGGSGSVPPEPAFRVPGGGDPVLQGHGMSLPQDPSEGAYPSGVSACASAALLLHALTADDRYRRAADRALAPLAELAATRAISFGATLELLTRLGGASQQLVLIEPDAAPSAPDGARSRGEHARHAPDGRGSMAAEAAAETETEAETGAGAGADTTMGAMHGDPGHVEADAAMRADGLRAAVRMWPGGAVVARATEAESRMLAEAGFELFAGRVASDGRPTVYLCTDFVCRLPATTAADLRR